MLLLKLKILQFTLLSHFFQVRVKMEMKKCLNCTNKIWFVSWGRHTFVLDTFNYADLWSIQHKILLLVLREGAVLAFCLYLVLLKTPGLKPASQLSVWAVSGVPFTCHADWEIWHQGHHNLLQIASNEKHFSCFKKIFTIIKYHEVD